MKTNQKVLIFFLFIAATFVVGSLLNLRVPTAIANFLMVPTLILYYRYKVKKWFLPMVIALLMFYARDIFMMFGFNTNPEIILVAFAAGILILYLFAFTGFKVNKVHLVEWISLLIMYGFLSFLFFSIGDLVPQVIPSFVIPTYIYLLLLTLLLAVTFTEYLLKSHYASLWLMLASASLLVSELSLFFKMYVIQDISVNIFFPLFHVIAYYAMVQHVIYRRRSASIPGF